MSEGKADGGVANRGSAEFAHQAGNLIGDFRRGSRRECQKQQHAAGGWKTAPHTIPPDRKIVYRHDKLCSAERILTRCG